jgi:hypothetical protein
VCAGPPHVLYRLNHSGCGLRALKRPCEMSAHAQKRVLLHKTIDLRLVLQRENDFEVFREQFFVTLYTISDKLCVKEPAPTHPPPPP